MKSIKILLYTVAMCLLVQTVVTAQTSNVSETFKTHFNKTVTQVADADNADNKRAILNNSFDKMKTAINRIETSGQLSPAELAGLNAFKSDIDLKSAELNGLNGFSIVTDEDLDDFSKYAQQAIEQADRNVTIGLGTVLLIIIILLLL
ncbi:MAG TPA: hypothetical protein DCE78_08220 [Bacteroidetes bacterium]|nr:hypothetical protein [Bacteroidota bacterium]